MRIGLTFVRSGWRGQEAMWVAGAKSVAVSKIVPHLNSKPGLEEKALSHDSLDIDPSQLIGAIAQCSHLTKVDPTFPTLEARMVRPFVEELVDDTAAELSARPRVGKLKDFVKGFFAGSIATGVAYLAMIRDGYYWHDHFESVKGGSAETRKRPDFIFLNGDGRTALMESKGASTGSLNSLDDRVSDGYVNQLEPHLGFAKGGGVATHGYCIGTFLKPGKHAELRVHHTSVPAAPLPPAPARGISPVAANIQRADYANMLTLVHSLELGRSIQFGEYGGPVTFTRFSWRGGKWLTQGSPFRRELRPELSGRWLGYMFAIKRGSQPES